MLSLVGMTLASRLEFSQQCSFASYNVSSSGALRGLSTSGISRLTELVVSSVLRQTSSRVRGLEHDQDGALRLRGFRSEIVSAPAPDCDCLFGLFDRATHRVPSGAPSKPSRITPSPGAK